MSKSNRREFIKGFAAACGAAAVGGCASSKYGFHCARTALKGDKLKFGILGADGKGWTDWRNALAHGEVPVAICDVDTRAIDKALAFIAEKGLDTTGIRTYTDYRRMFDDQSKLGMDMVTISTPDHMHAPQAITAMKNGIHCYIQKPLVRTLWESEYLYNVAKTTGCFTQLGNQGSAAHGFRRHCELLQQGVLGDVKEIYVWTDRPIWFQGDVAKKLAAGRTVHPPASLDWDSWLGTAADRAFPEDRPDGMKLPCKSQWALCKKGVYHTFNWRGFYDFGTGAFGDMACHTMNLPFRGAELGAVKTAEVCDVVEYNDVAFPVKSRVNLVYAARTSKARPGVKLPEVTVHWSEGGYIPEDPRLAPIMKVLKEHEKGEDPLNGCIFVGSKGMLASLDPYGIDCVIMMNGEKAPVNTKEHEACRESVIAPYIPRVPGDTSNIWTDTDREQVAELCEAIKGNGKFYKCSNSKCFCDVDYSTAILEGMLVGCMAQRLNRKLAWDADLRRFDDPVANSLMTPYIRPGWEF